jgi:hypothetical protein
VSERGSESERPGTTTVRSTPASPASRPATRRAPEDDAAALHLPTESYPYYYSPACLRERPGTSTTYKSSTRRPTAAASTTGRDVSQGTPCQGNPSAVFVRGNSHVRFLRIRGGSSVLFVRVLSGRRASLRASLCPTLLHQRVSAGARARYDDCEGHPCFPGVSHRQALKDDTAVLHPSAESTDRAPSTSPLLEGSGNRQRRPTAVVAAPDGGRPYSSAPDDCGRSLW